VANSGGDDVTVVDAATHRVIGSIETGPTPHGLIASHDSRYIYITGETDDDVVAVDTTTSKVLWKARVGDRPNEPALTANGRHIYVPIRSADYADVVDTVTKERIKSIPVGKAPHNAYPSPDGRWIYVTSRGEDKVTIIDPATIEPVAAVPVGGEPRPVAFTKDNRLMYVALTGLHGFVVVDIPQRKVIEKVELPMADLPEYSTYGYTATHGLGLRKDEKQFWITDVFGNAVEAFSVPEHKLLATIPVGLAPNWMTFSPNGEFLYVSNSGSNDVSVIDTELLREVVRIPVGIAPKRLLVVTVPEGMAGPEQAGWKTAAARPSTTDYYIKGGGILTAETSSFHNKFAKGELTAESAPALYRKLGLHGIAINATHIKSWENESLDRIRKALRDERRTLSALLLNGNLVSYDEAANSKQIAEHKRLMRAAKYLGAPVVRINLGKTGRGDAVDQTEGVERAIAALKQLLPAAKDLGIKMAIANQPGPGATAQNIIRIINQVDPVVVGVSLEIDNRQDKPTMNAEIGKLAPFAYYVRVKSRAFDKYGEETTIDYDEALAPLKASGYGAAISIEFEGENDSVAGVIKARDLVVKHWTGTAKTD
jgi:YVTN family beta-propeller protein